MPKKTIALVASLFLITVILLGVALNSKSTTKPTPKPSTEEPQQAPIASIAQTVLSLSPNPVVLNGANTGTIDVEIDTMENEITAVQLELKYDPKAITNVKIATEEFFAESITLINNADAKAGTATFAIGISPAQQPVKGKGTVAEITFTKVPGATVSQTEFMLLPTSLVTSSGVDGSVLKTATGTTITF